MESKTVNMEALKRTVKVIFQKVGVPEDQSALMADALVVTEAKGVYSHGIGLLARYVSEVQAGLISAHPNIQILHQTPGTVLLDGGNGLGAVVATRATEMAIEKAKVTGCATVCVRHTNHYGAGLYYVGLAAEQHMIAYLYANANPSMAPWGGKKKMLGTNPYSFGAPAGKYPPFILDMATSSVAFNKIINSRINGQRVPEGVGVDKDGKPTTDPEAIMDGGFLLPFGGIKGYGISSMVNIVAGVLSGAAYGPDIHVRPNSKEDPANLGFMINVIDIRAFMDVDTYDRRIEDFITQLKNTPRAEGVDAIHYPGDIEAGRLEQAKQTGIPLPATSVKSLRDAAELAGVDLGTLLA